MLLNPYLSKTLSGVVLGIAVVAQSTALAQTAPPTNETSCASLTEADIGGSTDFTLAGMNVVDYTVIYNGTTIDNLPAGAFTLLNIVGDAQDVVIRANGLDAGMNPVFDEITCSIPYNLPTCSASQDPDSSMNPVDIGTVITLMLDTTNAVTATIDGVPMTANVDPDTNFAVAWNATSTAVANSVLTAIATNPEGETTECTWDIQVNNQPPSPPDITQPVDGSTVLIEGLVNEEFVVEWSASVDLDGDPVTYDWELAADPGFSTVLLTIPDLSGTQVVLTLEAVAQLLADNGLTVGDSITLFHRATASDGIASSVGPAAEVTLTLGVVSGSLPSLPVPTLGPVSLAVLALLLLALAFIGRRRNGRSRSAH